MLKIYLYSFCSFLFLLQYAHAQKSSSKEKKTTKVRVSVWELYDARAFADENIYINPREIPNGKDDDKNGFVDDVYGIGFDYTEQPTNHNYTPIYDSSGKVLKRYFHGTGVTSILLRNNSNVELVGVGFLKYVDRPDEPIWLENLRKRLTGKPEEDIALLDNVFRISTAYFKAHGVKVVNISWSADIEFFRGFLKEIGIYSDDNFEKMRTWMKLFHDSLYKIFKENPDIFFVIAAGNDNKDIEEVYAVPAIIDLPNTITVGGLDETGKNKISFSNYGKNVKVYATATHKDVVVSSKHILPTAVGTSFATPVVTAYVAREIANGKTFQQIKKELIAQKYIISK
ncbi:MAG: S8 family serine peptidase [Raineya sp.]|nr:S8 family serine peptidase [Raineya sp.]